MSSAARGREGGHTSAQMKQLKSVCSTRMTQCARRGGGRLFQQRVAAYLKDPRKATKRCRGVTKTELLLSVYFESRCPDSKAFVLNQLRPALRLLPEHISLKLVPFGKARSRNNGYNGFQCQHGPAECLGNMVHSCTLELMQDRTDAEKVEYLSCEFETFAGSKGDLSCADKASVSPAAVKECLTSGRGTELQLNAEYFTKLVRPKWVPTVTVDGIFNQQIQDSAQVDLVGTLCSILKETPNCAQHYNSMAMRYVLF